MQKKIKYDKIVMNYKFVTIFFMELKTKILEFLDRNLVLDRDIIDEVRWSIDDLSEEQLSGVYDVLVDLDKKQTNALQEKLKETPWFFTEMEVVVSKEMYDKHIKEEEKEKKLIEKWLLEQLGL